MIDPVALLREVVELRQSAESVRFLDEVVERRSNAGKRQSLVDALKNVQASFLNTSVMKVAWQSGKPQNVIVKSVNGHLQPILVGSPVPEVFSDESSPLESEMCFTVSECFSRIEILKKRILEGELDHLLRTDARTLIHWVMGHDKELLTMLGIDSKQGEIYNRKTEQDVVTPNSEVDELYPGEKLFVQFVGTAFGSIINEFMRVNNIGQTPIQPPPITAKDEDDVFIGKLIKHIPAKSSSSSTVESDDVAVGVINDLLKTRVVNGKIVPVKDDKKKT